jgi:steroid 5-alpha reductase family enzyme
MNYYLILAIILWAYMSFWYVISIIRKRNDIADIAWGIGFIIMAWSSLYISSNFNLRGILICTLVTIWGLRLAWHINSRNKGKKEDYRYLNWRKQWGKWFYIRSYIQIYILQGTLLYIISTPILIVNASNNKPLGILAIIGILIWAIGFTFEVIADKQLKEFIKNKNNKGTIIQTGLWKYSRHPNYFGEVTLWWGLWLLAIPVELGWASIIGPLTITFLILKVSGIPMLEENLSKKPGWKEYKKNVSMFLPLPPKK